MMAALDERDRILANYMQEWNDLELDLVINWAALIPAPIQASL